MTFVGQIAELPIGAGGLSGNDSISQIRPDQLLEADSLSYDTGTLRKEGGASKYNSSAVAAGIVGGHDWHPVIGTQRAIILMSNGAVLKDTGGGTFPTTLKSGLTATKVPIFVEGGAEILANNRKLFLFTGSNQVQVLAADGATMADISTPPADWAAGNFPITGVIHEDRLWGALRHRVYYSLTANHEDFTTAGAGQLPIDPGQGEEIVALMPFKNFLIVFKRPTGIYFINTTDVDVTKWSIQPLNVHVGTVSPQSIVTVDEDVVFLDEGGQFHAMSGITELSFGSINISQANDADMGNFFRKRINFAEFDNVRMVYYVAKREIHCAVAQTGSTDNDGKVVIDLNRGAARFRFSTRDVTDALWMRKDSDGIRRPAIGDDAGFMWLTDEEGRSKGGVGYEFKLESAPTDLGFLDPALKALNKIGKFLELEVEPFGNWILTVDVKWDGIIKDTVLFTMGTTGATLGAFTLGTDELAVESVRSRKRRIRSGGRRFSLVAKNSGAGEDVSISRFFLYFLRGDEGPEDD